MRLLRHQGNIKCHEFRCNDSVISYHIPKSMAWQFDEEKIHDN